MHNANIDSLKRPCLSFSVVHDIEAPNMKKFGVQRSYLSFLVIIKSWMCSREPVTFHHVTLPLNTIDLLLQKYNNCIIGPLYMAYKHEVHCTRREYYCSLIFYQKMSQELIKIGATDVFFLYCKIGWYNIQCVTAHLR